MLHGYLYVREGCIQKWHGYLQERKMFDKKNSSLSLFFFRENMKASDGHIALLWRTRILLYFGKFTYWVYSENLPKVYTM